MADISPEEIRASAKPRGFAGWVSANLFFVAAGLIVIAVLIEHPPFTLVTHVLDGHEEGESLVINWESLLRLTLEFGFALLIAWVVAMGIEREVRLRDQREAHALREAIAQDVFKAVSGLAYGGKYAERVFEVALQAELLREYIDVTYRLDDLSPEMAQSLKIDASRFVVLTSTSRYTFKNVTSSRRTFDLQYAYAVRAGKLHDFNMVTRLEVRDGSSSKIYSTEEIREMTKSRGKFYAVCDYKVTADPARSFDILIENRMIKERSDNEIWATFYPTLRLKMVVSSRVHPKLVLGVRALTATNPDEYIAPDGQSGEWRVEKPMLPFDSLIFWWRTEEDDSGTPEDGLQGAAPAESSDVVRGETQPDAAVNAATTSSRA